MRRHRREADTCAMPLLHVPHERLLSCLHVNPKSIRDSGQAQLLNIFIVMTEWKVTGLQRELPRQGACC